MDEDEIEVTAGEQLAIISVELAAILLLRGPAARLVAFGNGDDLDIVGLLQQRLHAHISMNVVETDHADLQLAHLRLPLWTA